MALSVDYSGLVAESLDEVHMERVDQLSLCNKCEQNHLTKKDLLEKEGVSPLKSRQQQHSQLRQHLVESEIQRLIAKRDLINISLEVRHAVHLDLPMVLGLIQLLAEIMEDLTDQTVEKVSNYQTDKTKLNSLADYFQLGFDLSIPPAELLRQLKERNECRSNVESQEELNQLRLKLVETTKNLRKSEQCEKIIKMLVEMREMIIEGGKLRERLQHSQMEEAELLSTIAEMNERQLKIREERNELDRQKDVRAEQLENVTIRLFRLQKKGVVLSTTQKCQQARLDQLQNGVESLKVIKLISLVLITILKLGFCPFQKILLDLKECSVDLWKKVAFMDQKDQSVSDRIATVTRQIQEKRAVE